MTDESKTDESNIRKANGVAAVLDVRPFVGARDLDESRRFYETLGWTVFYESENLLAMNLAGHNFYLQRHYQKKWCENTMLLVSVDNVESCYQSTFHAIENAGFGQSVRVSGPPVQEDYGKVFYVWDPSGVLLHFTQFQD